jgi:hypothetical protein
MSGSDPTQMRNQPALTTSSGRIWLIIGVIAIAMGAGAEAH